MIWYYTVSYFLIGYISTLIYYCNLDEIGGKTIEKKTQKAVMLFFLWPIIVIGTIIIIPFTIHDKKKEQKNAANK